MTAIRGGTRKDTIQKSGQTSLFGLARKTARIWDENGVVDEGKSGTGERGKGVPGCTPYSWHPRM
jgi:hypothetical protein